MTHTYLNYSSVLSVMLSWICLLQILQISIISACMYYKKLVSKIIYSYGQTLTILILIILSKGEGYSLFDQYENYLLNIKIHILYTRYVPKLYYLFKLSLLRSLRFVRCSFANVQEGAKYIVIKFSFSCS